MKAVLRRLSVLVTDRLGYRQAGWWRRRVAALLLIAAGIGLFVAPFAGVSGYNLFLLNKALAFGLWAMGLDLLVGYTGLMSFGHVAWLGMGAYAAGYIARDVTSDIFIALLVCVGVVGIGSLIGGFIATRVSGVAFAIITLAIAATVYLGVTRLPPDFVGGRTGLFGVPLPTIFGKTIEAGTEFYLATAALVVVVFLAMRFLVRTPFGHSLLAIKGNEERAKFIGINVRAHAWVVFVLASVVSGLGGAMLGFLQGGMSTMEFQWLRSADVLIMLLLGGMGTLYGPVAGAILFTFLFDRLSSEFPGEWQIYLGLSFAAVVLFLPGGIAGSLSRLWSMIDMRLWASQREIDQ